MAEKPERRVLITYLELSLFKGSFASLLQAHGLDPMQPYSYTEVPDLAAWRYTQPPERSFTRQEA